MTTHHDDYLWDPTASPSDDIAAFERALAPYRFSGSAMRDAHPASSVFAAHRGLFARLATGVSSVIGHAFWLTPPFARVRVAFAWSLTAVAAGFVLLVGNSLWFNRPTTPWSITAESGTVAIQGDPSGRMTARAGDVLVTDADGRARLSVGTLGNVYLAPQSEVEVVAGEGGTERLVLRRGELHARIWATPRRFVVTTRSGTATDLGCVFTMRADTAGVGSIDVWQGAVELTGTTGLLYVAAGTSAPMGGAPGVPYPVRSGPAFRAASLTLASGVDDAAALAVLLADTSAQATTTLWHLLPRVTPTTRAVLVSRIAQVADLPPDATAMAQRVTDGDASAMAVWETTLKPQWSSEPNTAWRRFLVRWGFAKPVALLQLLRPTP